MNEAENRGMLILTVRLQRLHARIPVLKVV